MSFAFFGVVLVACVFAVGFGIGKVVGRQASIEAAGW